MEEGDHIISVINETQKALKAEDSLALKELSNQTIHCASCFQDPGTTTLPVLIYSLSKIIERKSQLRTKNWDKFILRIDFFLDLAKKSLKNNKIQQFEEDLLKARSALTSMSINLKPYIEEVLQKAKVNKAGKIYEHGISLGKTAQLLGISQWELSEYTGQGKSADSIFNESINIKKRAEMALEFFS